MRGVTMKVCEFNEFIVTLRFVFPTAIERWAFLLKLAVAAKNNLKYMFANLEYTIRYRNGNC